MHNNTNLTKRSKTAVLLVTLLTIVIALTFNQETNSNTAEAKPMSAMSNQSTMVNNTGVLVDSLIEETHVLGNVAAVQELTSLLPVTTYEQKAAEEPMASVSEETNVTTVTQPQEIIHSNETTVIEKKNTYKVTAEYLNIRTNPYNGSKIIDVLKKGTVVEITATGLGKDGKWSRLKMGGHVHSSYIVSTNDEPTSITVSKKPTKVASVTAVKKPTKTSSVSTTDTKPANPMKVGVNTPSNLSVEDVEKILKGTEMGGREIAEAIIAIEEEHNVNAFFTIAVGKLESGNGKSRLAKNKNNLFGLNATGDVYKNANSYDTKAESVYDFGRIIEKGYIDKGLTSVSAINKKYCPPNPDWKNLVSKIIQGDIKKL